MESLFWSSLHEELFHMRYLFFLRALPVIVLILPCLQFVGCRSYESAPIDWIGESAVWQTAPTNTVFTLEEATRCALILNPDINAQRVKRLATERKALASGWWNDPALNFDALRIVKGLPSPWILGSSLSFALPLNGVPGLEKRSAEAYSRADALAVTVAERELMRNVEEAGLCLAHTGHVIEQTEAFLARLTERRPMVQRLVAAGEMDPGDAERFRLEVLRLQTHRNKLQTDAQTQRLTLLALLGLHPATPVTFLLDEASAHKIPEWPSDEALVRHPRVLEKLARLEAGEEELLAEIRKQYPEVSLGPAYGNEEGKNRIGLTLGVSLPFWNRNRLGIAKAEGARDLARQQALTEWKRLVEDRTALATAHASARNVEKQLREERLPVAKAAVERIGKLFRCGESTLQVFIATEQSLFEAEADLAEAHHTLDELSIRAKVLEVGEQCAARGPETNE
jgi:outer membrane protein, heavy metal efflux system